MFAFMDEKTIRVTDEEKRWLAMLAEGKSTKEVADAFKIKPGTFAYKLNNLRIKTECENMASLMVYASKNGLI
jgi:DNA-binding CsgD family transcriptional regulator